MPKIRKLTFIGANYKEANRSSLQLLFQPVGLTGRLPARRAYVSEKCKEDFKNKIAKLF